MNSSARLWTSAKAWFQSHRKFALIIGVVFVILIALIIDLVIMNRSEEKKVTKEPANAIARQFSEKLPSLKDKADKNPSDFAAQRDYAIALYATGDTKGASAQYEKAVRVNGKDATTYNNLGNAYRDLGEFNKAVEAYNKAIDLNPKLINPYTNLANVQIYSLRKTDDAIDTYRKALKQLPNNPQLQVLLALAYEQSGDTAAAKQTLQTAQAANPDDKAIQANLTRLER